MVDNILCWVHPSFHFQYVLLAGLRVTGVGWSPSQLSLGEGRARTLDKLPHIQTMIHTHTCSQFIVLNLPHVHVFRLWAETGEPTKTQREHTTSSNAESNPQPSFLKWYCTLWQGWSIFIIWAMENVYILMRSSIVCVTKHQYFPSIFCF